MQEQSRVPPRRPIYCRESNWEMLEDQPSRVFPSDLGLPPLLDLRDVDWLDWAKKRLASWSWGGQHLALDSGDKRELRELRGGEMRRGERWKVQLDVRNFSPAEISVQTKDGYMQISGKHEAKRDEPGGVSRSFTRKYKLPLGLDLQHISSALSPEGLLSVEAPVEAPVSGSSSRDADMELVVPVQLITD
ncbi:unnamed protein product [Knipowitschia caucasica]